MTAESIPASSDKLPVSSASNLWVKIRDFIVYGIVQVRVLKKLYPGIMHFLIFWGVTIQVIGTAINLMQMKLFTPFELTIPRNNAYLAYELIMDIAGGAIIIGILMAIFRRLVMRPKTLETKWDDVFALVLLLIIPIMGFTTESFRLYATSPAWANWSPIGAFYSNLWRTLNISTETAIAIHPYLFWSHAALALIFVASIPFTKLRHLVFIPTNIIFRSRRSEGSLEKIENIDEAETLGVGRVTEFQSKQLLSFEACVQCGRCEEVCPSTISGNPYSPRELLHNLREGMISYLIPENNNATAEILGSSLESAYPWYCTTCGACIKKCPALINPVDQVIDLRRYQVLASGEMEKSVGDALRNIERQGNPWGMPAEDRLVWVKGLNIHQIKPGETTDVLLYLGCAFAYDDRNKKVAQSFVRILQKAGVDFAILGFDEVCCGETARRLGNEYLFQVMSAHNINTFSKVKFNRIVTQCPHCFNTLKNEYPQMGGNYFVQHYTEYLAEMIPSWKSIFSAKNSFTNRLAFHDSCYLGRYNDIYEEPRKLLEFAHLNKVELPRHGENSFCCGGGGGQMWMETDAETRINHRRLQEVLDENVSLVATACPYCLLMFDDAIRSKGIGDKIQALDLVELLEKQIL